MYFFLLEAACLEDSADVSLAGEFHSSKYFVNLLYSLSIVIENIPLDAEWALAADAFLDEDSERGEDIRTKNFR